MAAWLLALPVASLGHGNVYDPHFRLPHHAQRQSANNALVIRMR